MRTSQYCAPALRAATERGVGQQPAPRGVGRFEQCLGGDAAALGQQQAGETQTGEA